MTDADLIKRLYAVMVLCRAFEETFVRHALKDGVRVGHPYAGQEAVAAGVCCALQPNDRLLSTHRSHGHAVASGCDLSRLALELYGRADGLCRGRAGEMSVAQAEIGFMGASEIVGGNLATGAGIALAAKLSGSGRVAVAFLGEGGVNQGSFHETLNLAGVWSLPYVVVVENNHYAESTPVEYAVAGFGIATRALAYGIPGLVVDGQNVLAVFHATREALRRARSGGGPTLIEARTYRYYGHYYGDRHERYRTPSEIASWRARDPITAHRTVVLETGTADEAELNRIDADARERSEAALQTARAGRAPTWNDLVEDVFASTSGRGNG